jgi:hypothetical protein
MPQSGAAPAAALSAAGKSARLAASAIVPW